LGRKKIKIMTDLEKFKLVNSCETAEELSKAIIECSNNGIIKGKLIDFDALLMSDRVYRVINENLTPSTLTRNWGIRQQALYIKYYKDL
jgi:hypothetical protein